MSFSNLLDTLLRSSNRNTYRSAKDSCNARKLRLESLESREMLAVWVVDSLADPGVSGDNLTTLREAINQAGANDVVNFHPDLIGKTIILASTLDISKPLTIDGWNLPGEQSMPVDAFKGIMIDAKSLANATIINVGTGGSGSILRGLTITSSSPAGNIVESAIHANGNPSLSIENCVITNLTYSSKGVVNFNGDVLKITNTLIADNTSVFDGAAAVLYVKAASKATFYNCTVANNKTNASGTNFYGLYNDVNVNVFVRNSIFTGHSTADFHAKQANGITLEYSVYEKLGNASAGTGAIPYVPANDVLYLDGANRNYWLAPGSIALDVGNADAAIVNNNNGYNRLPANNDRGYDLVGNYRLKGAAAPYTIDAGAYTGGVTPQIIVTIEDDIVSRANDFKGDGSANIISLREAYGYIAKRYVSGNFNDPASFVTTPPGVGYDTILFASDVNNCRLTSGEISTNKSFAIIGTKPTGPHVTVHGYANMTDPGPNPGATTATRIFNVQSGTIQATNLNLRNAFARASEDESTSEPTYGKGGALYIASGATYEATGGTFSYNYASAAGGAIFVAQGGAFTGTAIALDHNKSVRGGGIANLGTASVLGASQFISNTAGGAAANGFGGAVYNAGTMEIGALNESQNRTTFSANSAKNITPAVGGQLLGGSGGAIYNTAGTLNVYHADFNNNVAHKYGGAISNFSGLALLDSNFSTNTAKAGGAIQTSGSAVTITGGAFAGNNANLSDYRLSADSSSKDFGGNGGAIFAGGASSNLTIQGNVSFTSNTAANAGGAIDYINGTLTFNEANVTIQNNTANVIGGAVVATKPITFTNNLGFTVDSNTAPYAWNVAVTCNVGDAAISNMANAFFGGPTTRDKLDTFIRYGSMLAGTELKFGALAQSFTAAPTQLEVKIDDAGYALWDSSSSTILPVGSHTVYYREVNSDVVFRANIQVLDATTSVVFSQIDLGERAYFGSKDYAVGVSLRVYSTAANPIPISSWTVNWDTEGGTLTETIDRFGFTLNAYHFYGAVGAYKVSLTAVDSLGNSRDYGHVGDCVVHAPASAAVLQEEIFADNELLDELFVDF
jgi:hypothetical protein